MNYKESEKPTAAFYFRRARTENKITEILCSN